VFIVIVVYSVTYSDRKLLDTHSYTRKLLFINLTWMQIRWGHLCT